MQYYYPHLWIMKMYPSKVKEPSQRANVVVNGTQMLWMIKGGSTYSLIDLFISLSVKNMNYTST